MTSENNSVMLICGNSISPWCVRPDGDMTWNRDDWGRAQTLEVRFHRLGLKEDERRMLVSAAVWRAKYPGMRFNDDIMKRLNELCFQ